MKKIITKIFLSTFVVWFFSLWLSFVYGQNCNVWTQCYTQWCSNAANYSWFNNSTNAYSVCSSDSTCKAYLDWDSKYGDWGWLTHVQWNIPKIWSMVNLSVPNQWWCSNQTNPTCQGVANNVKTMQNTLKVIWCFKQHDEQRWNAGDCLLGYDTLYDMTHCCIWEGESLPNIDSPWSSATASCSDPQFLITNAYNQQCCVSCPEWQEPIEDCNGQTAEECCEENKICDAFTQVNRDYRVTSTYPWMAESFDKDNCCRKVTPIPDLSDQMVGKDVLEWLPFCDWLDICENALQDWSCDYLGSWYADDGYWCCEEMCPPPLKNLTWGNCNSWWDGFVQIEINWYQCCKQCENPPMTWSCNYLWSGRFLSWDCCDYKCPKIWQTAPDGKKLDEKNCKWICDPTKTCCGIELNTVVPFIWDCIEMTSQNDVWSWDNENTSTLNQLNAFPFLMMGLSKILVTVILIFSFLIVIAAWLMMTTGVYSEQNYKKGMERVQKVVVGLILLWASGLILKLINPSFFGG